MSPDRPSVPHADRRRRLDHPTPSVTPPGASIHEECRHGRLAPYHRSGASYPFFLFSSGPVTSAAAASSLTLPLPTAASSRSAKGNAIVAVIAEAKLFPERWIEFFFFAGLMVVFIVIFVLFTFNYRYVEDIAAGGDPSDAAGLAGLGGHADDDDGHRSLPSSSDKSERRKLMKDNHYGGVVVDDAETPRPPVQRGNKRDSHSYEPIHDT